MGVRKVLTAGLAVVLVLTLSGCGKKESVPVADTEPVSGESGPAEPEVKGVTIFYGEAGFEPEISTVSAGTKVTFINQSQDGLWVKGDPEVLQKLAAFDQSISMEKGSTYTYTFTEVGEWGYYNQVNPEDGGMIVVY